MQQYLNLLQNILDEGDKTQDRTGTGTLSIFGTNMRFDLQKGLPLLTTKKVAFKPIVAELLWFLEGSTNNNRLNELGAKIWNPWATFDGELGPVYGKQWVNWDDNKIINKKQLKAYDKMGYNLNSVLGDSKYLVTRQINQIQNIIEQLKREPESRRHVVSAWNPADLPLTNIVTSTPDDDNCETFYVKKLSPQDNVNLGNAALAFCHAMFQFKAKEIPHLQRVMLSYGKNMSLIELEEETQENIEILDYHNVPKYKLSCQIYQRKQHCAF